MQRPWVEVAWFWDGLGGRSGFRRVFTGSSSVFTVVEFRDGLCQSVCPRAHGSLCLLHCMHSREQHNFQPLKTLNHISLNYTSSNKPYEPHTSFSKRERERESERERVRRLRLGLRRASFIRLGHKRAARQPVSFRLMWFQGGLRGFCALPAR